MYYFEKKIVFGDFLSVLIVVDNPHSLGICLLS